MDVSGTLIAIAADGLGSSALSQCAARFACEWSVRRVAAEVGSSRGSCRTAASVERVLRRVFFEAAELLERASAAAAADLGLLTTVLGAVCTSEFSVLFNNGDGVAAAFKTNVGGIEELALLPPEHGNYVGEVHPLLPHDFDRHFRTCSIARPQRILLGTDGVADFALSEDERALKADFAVAFAAALDALEDDAVAPSIEGYLSGANASSANGDDKTLVWIEFS